LRLEAGGQRLLFAQHFDWQSAADVAMEGLLELADRIPKGQAWRRQKSGII